MTWHHDPSALHAMRDLPIYRDFVSEVRALYPGLINDDSVLIEAWDRLIRQRDLYRKFFKEVLTAGSKPMLDRHHVNPSQPQPDRKNVHWRLVAVCDQLLEINEALRADTIDVGDVQGAVSNVIRVKDIAGDTMALIYDKVNKPSEPTPPDAAG